MTILEACAIVVSSLMAISIVLDVRRNLRAFKEFKEVNSRFEEATAELESHVRRLDGRGRIVEDEGEA